jgi:integrative and conjugative element protein (TIGR02256 family)
MLTISIPHPILDGIFDECDRYAVEETGGRLLGFYTWRGTDLHIDVQALIAAGPSARRSRTSFFQDGEYQERLFRAVEKKQPKIEHLGNWHTHHVNGLRTLSQGDCETYRKFVNSQNHNTDFFYALLVTHSTPRERTRYGIRHFVFVRHTTEFVEVPARDIDMTASRVLQL